VCWAYEAPVLEDRSAVDASCPGAGNAFQEVANAGTVYCYCLLLSMAAAAASGSTTAVTVGKPISAPLADPPTRHCRARTRRMSLKPTGASFATPSVPESPNRPPQDTRVAQLDAMAVATARIVTPAHRGQRLEQHVPETPWSVHRGRRSKPGLTSRLTRLTLHVNPRVVRPSGA